MPRAPVIWYAEEGSISVNSQLLSTRVTNIEVTGGERDAETLRTFGRGTFLAERPQQNFETNITAIVSGLDFAQHVFGLGSATVGGRLISGDGVRTAINVVYTWADPTTAANQGPQLRLRFASGFGTQLTMTHDAEGELQQTFTFKSTPGNTFWEYSSGNALVTPSV